MVVSGCLMLHFLALNTEPFSGYFHEVNKVVVMFLQCFAEYGDIIMEFNDSRQHVGYLTQPQLKDILAILNAVSMGLGSSRSTPKKPFFIYSSGTTDTLRQCEIVLRNVLCNTHGGWLCSGPMAQDRHERFHQAFKGMSSWRPFSQSHLQSYNS